MSMTNLAAPPAACRLSLPTTASDWIDAIPGERVRVHVASRAFGGRLTVIESLSEPGAGAPLHIHPDDEVFHVVEGLVTFDCAGERFEAGPGAIVAVPAGTPHRWSNFSDGPARMMVMLTPGGFEELLVKVSGMAPGEIVEAAREFGVEVLGPPMERD